MVLYAVFITNRLEPGDRGLVVEGLGNSAASMHQPTAALGPVWYRRALAFDLWCLQIALGRLVPVLYALRSCRDGNELGLGDR